MIDCSTKSLICVLSCAQTLWLEFVLSVLKMASSFSDLLGKQQPFRDYVCLGSYSRLLCTSKQVSALFPPLTQLVSPTRCHGLKNTGTQCTLQPKFVMPGGWASLTEFCNSLQRESNMFLQPSCELTDSVSSASLPDGLQELDKQTHHIQIMQ